MNLFNKILVVFLLSIPVVMIGQTQDSDYSLFGEKFELQKTFNKADQLSALSSKDSIPMQLKGEIVEVCQSKGCWMKVDLTEDKQVFVRFKDYGFFVPKDAAEKTTILNGIAFVEEMSVEDQRHYAEDKGASESEIAKITEPKKTLRFEAAGVLIKE